MNTSNTPTTVCLISLGCPKNLVDSEVLLARLGSAGFVVGAPMAEADIIVINTCAFLAAAREESLSVIEEAVDCKRSGSARKVIVAGCLPNRDREELLDATGDIDAIVGTTERERIVDAATSTGTEAFLPGPCSFDTPGSDGGRLRLTPRHTAYLRIAEGCSRRCTFCAIPAIRGPFRSKSSADVLAEARELVDDGAIELNIIAQETTAYGEDTGDDLPALLRRLDSCGAAWLRLMYTHPRRFSNELIETMADCTHVLPYVDIPLQHCAAPVLRRMGRGHGREHIEDILGELRRRIPAISIRTSFITGFPGETDKDFAELLAFVERWRFEAVGVFEFSPEEGTPAARLPGQLSRDIAAERARAIMATQQTIAFDTAAAMAGKELAVLVDGIDGDGRCIGRWAGQAPDIDGVCILSRKTPPGTLAGGTVRGRDGYDLLVDLQ